MVKNINILNKQKPLTPMLFIIMGVSGTGKSSVAIDLADELSIIYVDADDFHSEQAKQHMADNKPLTDDMRKPWLAAILQHLQSLYQQGKSVVLAYSGLKSAHRALFRNLAFTCHFFCLIGDKQLIVKRMSQRDNHFFSADLLDSQFAAMEFPNKDEVDVSLVDINRAFNLLAAEIHTLTEKIIEKANHEQSF